MFELVVRMTNLDKDVEVLKCDHVKGVITEKKISVKAFLKALNNIASGSGDYRTIKPTPIPKGCIGWNSLGENQVYVINQPEHQRYVTYSCGQTNKAYKINYPNSVFVVNVSSNRIMSITHYMYDEWEDMETKLYYPAMPNSALNVCLGMAKRDIDNGDIIAALENIIYAPYSHSTVNNAKGFKSTEKYFEWLSENHMSKKYLVPYEGKLKDIYGGNL